MSINGPTRLILAGCLTTVSGLAVSGTAPIAGIGSVERIEAQQTLGGVLVLLGWGLFAWGIHRFGRASD